MKNNKIVAGLAFIVLGSSPSFAAENKVADFQASAEIENVCLIEADDVNFGQVYAPLTQQGTKSEIRVLCSKGTNYTLDLNYGGNMVDPSGNNGDYNVKVSYKNTETYNQQTGNTFNSYRIFKNGEPIGNGHPSSDTSNASIYFNLLGDNNAGDFQCATQYPNRINFYSVEAAQLLSNTNQVLEWIPDSNSLCSGGYINSTTFNNISNSIKTNSGIMLGSIKGDGIAYQITMPGDISKPWIANVNSYKAIASGEFDKVEVNARVIPNSSSSLYPAQDNYFDTVTAVISY